MGRNKTTDNKGKRKCNKGGSGDARTSLPVVMILASYLADHTSDAICYLISWVGVAFVRCSLCVAIDWPCVVLRTVSALGMVAARRLCNMLIQIPSWLACHRLVAVVFVAFVVDICRHT